MNSELAVLIVDDESDLRTSTRRILQLDGYQVETAGSLAEMFDRDNWSKYFAILLDRRLPDGMADQAFAELERLAPETAIIICTAYADLEGALAALKHGAEDYFLKPVDPTQLRARLRSLAELRSTKTALSHQRAFAELIIDTTRALIMVLDPQGAILRVNRYFEELVQIPAESLLGQSMLELVPQPQRSHAKERLSQCVTGSMQQGASQWLLNAQGQCYEIAWWTALVKNPNHDITEVVYAGLDMTQQNELQRQLIQSQRLAAIGEAMTGLAHESRNTLQRSQMCLDILSQNLSDRPEELDLLASVQQSQDELYRLYEEVRTYAAPIQLQVETTDVASLVQKVWNDVRTASSGVNAEMTLQSNDTPTQCEVDPFAMEQVFRNVLENAVQACGAAARIHVVLTRESNVDNDSLQIAIRDNGPGIASDQVEKIFDSFHTSKPKGTGLGLSIAKRIVEEHGGRIRATSMPEGAEFVVSLPFVHSETSTKQI